MLAAKRASLPKEPLPNAEGAVTVVVRMPDGSRQGRRFLKSDQLQVSCFQLLVRQILNEIIHYKFIPATIFLIFLQVLFDFIDISRTFKPGTYRLVILSFSSIWQIYVGKRSSLEKDQCSYHYTNLVIHTSFNRGKEVSCLTVYFSIFSNLLRQLYYMPLNKLKFLY